MAVKGDASNSKRYPASARRRAVSQIIGTLMMLGVVAVVGGVIFIKGTQIMTDFNFALSSFSHEKTEKIQEKIVITHISFSGDDQATVYLRNVGMVDSDIATLKILNRNDQTLECCTVIPTTSLPIQEPVSIQVTLANDWDTPGNRNDDYKVSVVTARDNTFEKFVRPPNG